MSGDAAWKTFEKLISTIQQRLAPTAIVRHDHRMRGKSGSLLQFDISITQQVGSFTILVVLECKRYTKRPVLQREVRDFHAKLSDIGAHRGGIVSYSGFDKGAERFARLHNIALFTYHDAITTDCNAFIRPTFYASLSHCVVEPVDCVAKVESDGSVFKLPISFDSPLYNRHGQQVSTIEAQFWIVWLHSPGDRPPVGPASYDFSVTPHSPAHSLYLRNGDTCARFVGAEITGTIHAKVYRAEIGAQHEAVLSDDTLGTIYHRCRIQFDPSKIRESKEFRDMTPEEYLDLRRNFKEHGSVPSIDEPLEYIVEFFSDKSR